MRRTGRRPVPPLQTPGAEAVTRVTFATSRPEKQAPAPSPPSGGAPKPRMVLDSPDGAGPWRPPNSRTIPG